MHNEIDRGFFNYGVVCVGLMDDDRNLLLGLSSLLLCVNV